MNRLQRMISELVGPLSPVEVATLLGRRSTIRAAARDLGVDQFLPEPPPVGEDASLRYAAADALRRARSFSRRRGSKSQCGSRSVHTSSGASTPAEKTTDGAAA